MAIRKRGKNWYVDIYINGKRIKKVVGPSKKEAQIYEGKIKAEAYEGKYFDTKKGKKREIEELLNEYLQLCHQGIRKVKPSTIKRYELCKKNLIKYLKDTRVSDVSTNSLKEYIDFRKKDGITNSTINRELSFLKACYSQAVKWEWVQSNPVKKIDLLKEPKGRVRYLTPDERNALLTALPWYIRPIVLFALYTGMRKEEILSLKWSQISFKDRLVILTETKNSETRSVPLCDTALAVLKDVGQVRRLDIDYVFFSPLTDDRWKDIHHKFKRVCREIGLHDFRFHDLRHTAASYLVMSGVDLNMVREILGHTTTAMTLRYAHLSQTAKVHEVKKLDGAFERLQKQEKEQSMVPNWSQIEKVSEVNDYATTMKGPSDAGKMAGETGLEPATLGFGDRCSTN